MLALFKVIVMGIVQGLSEFLPISSSGHLVFTSHLIEIISQKSIPDESSYDIVLSMMLHVGTLIAVFVFFWREVADIFVAFVRGCKNKCFSDYNAMLGLYIALGTVITIVVALILNDTAERLMYSPAVVGVLLMVTGCVLYGSERYSETIKDKETKLSKKTAIVMSIAQGLAALPGFSRSGWTIASGLFTKADRVTCARFSFLLSIPIILGASIVYPIMKVDFAELVSYNWLYIIVGTVVSAIVGYLCIKYFLQFLAKYSLKVFAYYCLIVGFVACLFFTFI